MSFAEQRSGSPVAETQTDPQQGLLQLRDGESTQRQYRGELQQFAAAHAAELALVASYRHYGLPMDSPRPPSLRKWDARMRQKLPLGNRSGKAENQREPVGAQPLPELGVRAR